MNLDQNMFVSKKEKVKYVKQISILPLFLYRVPEFFVFVFSQIKLKREIKNFPFWAFRFSNKVKQCVNFFLRDQLQAFAFTTDPCCSAKCNSKLIRRGKNKVFK